jgi:hypothetical protein
MLCYRARSGGYLLLGMVVGDGVTAGAWATIEIAWVHSNEEKGLFRTNIDVDPDGV